MATPVRVYVAFDFDNDQDLKNLLVGQARHSDSPFEIADWSLKEEQPEAQWKAKAREKIRRVAQVAVIVGEYTYRAPGVRAEVEIADAEAIQYFAIRGRADRNCPAPAFTSGRVYNWTWDNLKVLVKGGR